MPNWALLKHPGNWFFVAFCLITLFALLYFVTPDKTGDQ